MNTRDRLRYRIAPLEMIPSEFRKVGRQLVERIAEFLSDLYFGTHAHTSIPSTLRDILNGMLGAAAYLVAEYLVERFAVGNNPTLE